MKYYCDGFILLLCISFICSSSFAGLSSDNVADRDIALIMLDNQSLDGLVQAKKLIRQCGGRVRHVIPPAAIIAGLSSDQADRLAGYEMVSEVTFDVVDADRYDCMRGGVGQAVRCWNKIKSRVETSQQEPELSKCDGWPDLQQDDVLLNESPDLDAVQKRKATEDYLKGWRTRRDQLKAVINRQSGYDSAIDSGLKDSGDAPDVIATGDSGPVITESAPGYYDTSLFLIGDVAVDVYFTNNEGGLPSPALGEWSDSQVIDDYFAFLVDSLDFLIDAEPNAHLSFTYHKEVDAGGNPLPTSTDERQRNNDIRQLYGTDWAYIAEYRWGNGTCNAYLLGPSTRLYTEAAEDYVIRHETMHIFGAMDQYTTWGYQTTPGNGRSPTAMYGYLNVVNANSEVDDGSGYFDGAGEGMTDIMNTGGRKWGMYTRGQLGWQDSDGDGVLDPVDTLPKSQINSVVFDDDDVLIEGVAEDQPYYIKSNHMASINHITQVQYAVNDSGWINVDASDGSYDSTAEAFTINITGLCSGLYCIRVRSINSVGNTDLEPINRIIHAIGSSAPDATPWATFTAERIIPGTWLLDASGSRDLETPVGGLLYRWDFDNNGSWDTSFTGQRTQMHEYSTPGDVACALQVQDEYGNVNDYSCTIPVVQAGRPPLAKFMMDDVVQYGPASTYPVTFDANRSSDMEDGQALLQVRWDMDYYPGVVGNRWDTDYLDSLSYQQVYPLAQDISGNTFYESANLLSRAIASYGDLLAVAVMDGTTPDVGLRFYDITVPANPVFISELINGVQYIEMIILDAGGYIVCNDSTGIDIYDISDIHNPILASHINSPNGAPTPDMAVHGDYLYTVHYDEGMCIHDISNRYSPINTGCLNKPGGNGLNSVDSNGQYVFALGNDLVDNELVQTMDVFDVQSPYSPYYVASLHLNEHKKDSLEYMVHDSGYVFTYNNHGFLYAIDVSDPADPFVFSSTALDREMSKCMKIVDGRLYIAYAIMNTVDVVNIADMNNQYVEYTTNLSTSVTDITVKGNYLYSACTGKLEVFDIQSVQNHNYSGVRKVRLEVKDSEDNTDIATRDLSFCTYNHSPQITNLTQVADQLTVTADDPDIATAWDGLLEYRWDYDGDGIWDTEFNESNSSITVPQDLFAGHGECEVRDRFSARDQLAFEYTVLNPAPSDVTAQVGGPPLNIMIEWTDQSTNEDGFLIERKAPGDDEWQMIALVQPGFTSFTDSSVQGHIQYIYRVGACKD